MSIIMNFERQFLSNKSKSLISFFRYGQCEMSAGIYAPDIILMSIHAEHEQGTVLLGRNMLHEQSRIGKSWVKTRLSAL